MVSQSRPRVAVVLAHGVGAHCFPFGGDKAFRPKYAHEVGGIPLVNHVIDAVLGAGVERVIVVAGFKAARVHALTGRYGAKVATIDAPDYTHGDARPLAEAIKARSIATDLLVVNGDLLTVPGDYEKLIGAFAGSTGSSCALVDELDPNEDKPSWTTVHLSGDGSAIESICGRVENEKIRLSGMYAFSAGDLGAFGELSANEERIHISNVVGRLIGKGSRIGAVRATGPIVHVDRAFDYLEANQTVLRWAVEKIPSSQGAYVYVGGEGEPNPEYIFPGTIINPGARVVMEADSFIGPYDTKEAHLAGLKTHRDAIIPIRIRGGVHLGPRSRIGLNALIEGNLVVGAESYIEDSVIEKNVLVCDRVAIRRNAVIRGFTVCGDNTRFECAADFEGVAGTGTINMHPLQCWVVTGEGCDLGAGNFFGTWRFDSGICTYVIDDRKVKPKNERIGNASYMGDNSRTGVGVMVAPGTRVGPDCMLGIGHLPGGCLEAGYGYLPKQQVARVRVGLLTRRKRTD